MNSTNALATTLDAPLPTTAIATSATTITATVSALPTYTNKIDLMATPVASNYTTLNMMALGSVNFTVNPD